MSLHPFLTSIMWHGNAQNVENANVSLLSIAGMKLQSSIKRQGSLSPSIYRDWGPGWPAWQHYCSWEIVHATLFLALIMTRSSFALSAIELEPSSRTHRRVRRGLTTVHLDQCFPNRFSWPLVDNEKKSALTSQHAGKIETLKYPIACFNDTQIQKQEMPISCCRAFLKHWSA